MCDKTKNREITRLEVINHIDLYIRLQVADAQYGIMSKEYDELSAQIDEELASCLTEEEKVKICNMSDNLIKIHNIYESKLKSKGK
jgi:hypothetical protein